jgi:hypothetical protein
MLTLLSLIYPSALFNIMVAIILADISVNLYIWIFKVLQLVIYQNKLG